MQLVEEDRAIINSVTQGNGSRLGMFLNTLTRSEMALKDD